MMAINEKSDFYQLEKNQHTTEFLKAFAIQYQHWQLRMVH
jgi:hypothetical protein